MFVFKGTFSRKKVADIIALNDRFGPNQGTPTLHKILKSFVKKLRLFIWGRSRCKRTILPFLHRERPHLKSRCFWTNDFKNLKSVGVP
jgi:hypothetical protein